MKATWSTVCNTSLAKDWLKQNTHLKICPFILYVPTHKKNITTVKSFMAL